MSLVNTLGFWWLPLGLIPPLVILLYFLKLRRQPLEVPSTFLWSRTIEDLHVNSIWQRLRQSLLLFLQLLLLALLILACAKPSINGVELVGERFIFLIDTSASMSATEEDGQSRLEVARQQVQEFIDKLQPRQAAMIISCSNEARVEHPFTFDRYKLGRALRKIEVTSRPTDLKEALRYAAGLANPASQIREGGDEAQSATLIVFSDGGFGPIGDFAQGNLEIKYQSIGQVTVDNLAIVAFSTDRNPEKPGKLEIFGQLENFAADQIDADVKLKQDGKVIDVVRVSAPGKGSSGVEFSLPEFDEGVLELELDRDDQLAADNRAWSVVNRARKAKVLLITAQNDPLMLALGTEQAIKISDVQIAPPVIVQEESHKQAAAAGKYDLIIYDQCAPLEMPQANTVFFGAKPPLDTWKFGETQPPLIIDVDRVHPLTQLMDLGAVRIIDAQAIEAPSGATQLVDAHTGTIMSIAPRLGFEDLVIGFSLFSKDEADAPNTNWVKRRSFPVFVMNVLKYLGGGSGGQGNALSIQPGSPAQIRTDVVADEIRVVMPNGDRSLPIKRKGQSAFYFGGTNQLGIYQVRPGTSSEAVQRFSVNLFDPQESDIAARPDIDFEVEKVEASSGTTPSRRELWKWLLGLGLFVLIFEWYIYNRRVYL